MNHRKISLSIAAFALVAAACGGSATDTEAPAAPATTAAPTTMAPTTTAAPTTTVPETTTTVGAAPASELAKLLVGAGEQASEISSARMEATFEISGIEGGPDEPLAFGLSAAFDNESGAFSFSMDLGAILDAAPPGEEIPDEFAELFREIEMRVVDDVGYVKFPFINTFLGVETDWLSVPAEDVSSGADFGLTPAAPANPADLLEAFGAADGELEEVGRETVRGVETTHYRIRVDMQTLLEQGDAEDLAELEQLGPLPEVDLPIDLWVGDDGLVYRFVLDIDGSQVEATDGQEFDRMVLTFEMFDYGAPVVVEAPDPADVTDSSELGDSLDFGELFGDG